MAVEYSVTEKTLVVQHNKIIEARYKLSVGEQRLVKLLVSMIESEDEDFKRYKIAVADLAALLGIKSGDIYSSVKKATKKLIGNVLTFDDGNETIQAAWLASAHYKKGLGSVELQFAPILKPFLLHLKKHFTSYELGNVINLKHTYSIRIYELLKQYERIGKRKFSVLELRRVLALDDDEYKQFCDFRRWVLNVAQKELSEKTDISFTWEEERKNQKCVALEFIIKSQKRPQNRKEKAGGKNTTVVEGKKVNAQDAMIEDDKPQPMKETQQSAPVDENFSRLVALGVHADTAQELVKGYGGEEIKVAIDYAERLHREKGLSNFAGFVVQAIRKGFKDGEAEKRRQAEEEARRKRENEERRKRWEAVKKRYKEACGAVARQYLDDMGEDEAVRAWEEFYKAQTPSTRSMVLKNKDSHIAEAMFLQHLQGKITVPPFLEWATKNGVDVSDFMGEMRRDGLA